MLGLGLNNQYSKKHSFEYRKKTKNKTMTKPVDKKVGWPKEQTFMSLWMILCVWQLLIPSRTCWIQRLKKAKKGEYMEERLLLVYVGGGDYQTSPAHNLFFLSLSMTLSLHIRQNMSIPEVTHIAVIMSYKYKPNIWPITGQKGIEK